MSDALVRRLHIKQMTLLQILSQQSKSLFASFCSRQPDPISLEPETHPEAGDEIIIIIIIYYKIIIIIII